MRFHFILNMQPRLNTGSGENTVEKYKRGVAAEARLLHPKQVAAASGALLFPFLSLYCEFDLTECIYQLVLKSRLPPQNIN